MNFKYKALLLFIILVLGLILCSFLGGNCGIRHVEGFTKKSSSNSDNDNSSNLNTIATFYGPGGKTAQIVQNSINSYSIVVTEKNTDCNNENSSNGKISGNEGFVGSRSSYGGDGGDGGDVRSGGSDGGDVRSGGGDGNRMFDGGDSGSSGRNGRPGGGDGNRMFNEGYGRDNGRSDGRNGGDGIITVPGRFSRIDNILDFNGRGGRGGDNNGGFDDRGRGGRGGGRGRDSNGDFGDREGGRDSNGDFGDRGGGGGGRDNNGGFGDRGDRGGGRNNNGDFGDRGRGREGGIEKITGLGDNKKCESTRVVLYHSSSTSTSTSYENDVYYGTNGNIAKIITINDGTTAIEITSPNKTVELYTPTAIPSFTVNNMSNFNQWSATPQTSTTTSSTSQTNYDNYNHYTGLSVSTVYYGPGNSTAKVVETSNSYNIIVTYPNGETVIYTSNTNVTPDEIYVTVYTGPNGKGKAVFITDNNGNKALEITMPNGTIYLFTVTNQQTYNPDYINNTTYTSPDSYNYSTTTTTTSSDSTNTITSTIYYGPNGETARVVQSNNSFIVIVTYHDGQTAVYKSNSTVTPSTIYITVYYGFYGGKAIFINNNGTYTLEITTPNGNIIMFTTTPVTQDTSANAYTNTYAYPYTTYQSTSTMPPNPYSTPSEINNYNTALPYGIPGSQIPPGSEDLYILKSEIVPPVCPACPSIPTTISREETCPPCPACERCPQPNFECKKVPNYDALAEEYIPVPVLSDFSQFGM
jgi:hypothetical protein